MEFLVLFLGRSRNGGSGWNEALVTLPRNCRNFVMQATRGGYERSHMDGDVSIDNIEVTAPGCTGNALNKLYHKFCHIFIISHCANTTPHP